MIPNIRLKGFTDDWSEKTMGELYTERNERGNDSLQILSVSIHSGVSGGELDEEGLGKVVRRSEDKSTYKHVYEGDLVFNMMRAWQGAIGVVKSEGMISPAYISAIPNDEVYPLFMDYALRRKEAVAQINNLSYGVTDFRKRLYWDSFVKVKCQLPSVAEQKKITDLLEQLEALILDQEQVYKDLRKYKQYMLRKLFPKDGETVPEIRIAGFSDPWGKIKLSEIAEKVTEKNTDLAINETFTNSAEFGIISQRDFFDRDISNANSIDVYYVVRNEDFVYNPRISVTAPVGPINRNKLGRNGVMSPLYTVFRTHDIHTAYLEWFFKGNCWHSFMLFNGDSGVRSDRFSIKDAVFFEMPIYVPCLEEQKKLASFFDNLDTHITAHQRKLETLQSFKNYLLQNLFPQEV